VKKLKGKKMGGGVTNHHKGRVGGKPKRKVQKPLGLGKKQYKTQNPGGGESA